MEKKRRERTVRPPEQAVGENGTRSVLGGGPKRKGRKRNVGPSP